MPDPLHEVQSRFFSNAFSNVDDYVRSRLNISEIEAQCSNRPQSPANMSELVSRRWHARGQGFESPYLHFLTCVAFVQLTNTGHTRFVTFCFSRS